MNAPVTGAAAPRLVGRVRGGAVEGPPRFAVEAVPGKGRRYSWPGGEVTVSAEHARVAIEGARLAVVLGPAAGPDPRDWLDLARAGAPGPERLRGRFGLLAVDAETGAVALATDRFGTLPWCHAARGGELFFSDRADRVEPDSGEIDPQALFDYFYFHVIPAPRTVFRGVSRLPQASVLRWNGGEPRVSPWWTPRFTEPAHAPLEAAKERFLELVEASVRREADAPHLATFLSGGTDSSTVSGMLCRIGGRPAASYSIGFDAAGYDEMAYARIAARHFGTEHHEYYVTPDDLLEAIPTVAAHYDQPFGNSSAVPAWLCARNARADGVDKMLAGDGGDELFGGNARYAKQRVFEWYGAVPRALRAGLVEPALALPGVRALPLLRKAASYVEQARVPLPDRSQMYNLLLRLGARTVFEPAFLEAVDQDAPLAMQRATWQAAQAQATINRTLAFDWKYTLADNDLPKVLGTTQLAGVEVGFPLLSDELVDFSLGLPPEWKLKGLTLRWFFKEALRGFLPEAIIRKKKHGFGLPFGVWATRHAGLGRLARDSLERFAARGLLRAEFAADLMGRLLAQHPGYYGEMVWVIMIAEQWMQAREARAGVPLRA